MAFLDKLGSLAKNAADKTNEMMETSKLNSKINESKSKITARKTQIGEHYWAKYESGETLDAEVMELCDAIRAENEAIEEFSREIQKIKAVPPPSQANVSAGDPASAPCTACGQPVPAGKRFCPECGAPMSAPEPAPSIDAEPVIVEPVRCSGCGGELPEGKKFCPECGAPVTA